MTKRKNLLGIDVGSISVSIAVIDDSDRIIHTSYTFHKGQIAQSLAKLLKEVDLSKIKSAGYTSSTPKILTHGTMTDSRVAYITAAKLLNPGVKALLIIGAEKFGLVTFNEQGEYLNYKPNTSCAAGTGNFLDQQAERLNLKNIKEFSTRALANKEAIPLIASRCAVFAKTDLIHVQQEGYSLEAICDGLCYGLAKNIVDTVFFDNNKTPVVAAGGVALNQAVIKHLEKITGQSIIADKHASVYGAIGAALNSKEEGLITDTQITDAHQLIISEKKEKKLYYPPLELKLSDYPDFESLERYEFQSTLFPAMKPVEIDIYSRPAQHDIPVYLGIDIGSTSTKAVLLSRDKEVITGLYTRTSGQPLRAVQVIFESIIDLEKKHGFKFNIVGVGTTGSGRKFVGKILGADLMLDEITAHASAAYELNPNTDTIIEIGGQDSKFTFMNDGMVTFSVMNNICAAGTGNFIEEQAKRLECPLSEYSQRTENAKAPLASDRCTVFMERDLNYYQNEGYEADEILASVLHSIRDNYLTKVASEGQIGKNITFQGATAKNKSLLAAFEQKLQKPINVSKFCHLTGALGTALELNKENAGSTKFRGLDLYKKEIPVYSETCKLCTNNCKLKVAKIGDEIEAYGFLCGRDYNEKKFVKNPSLSFNLTSKRKEIFKITPKTTGSTTIIGIPAGLHLYEELHFWRKFFDLLSIQTITSENYKSPVKDGKKLSGAEFCAPITAIYGHVDYLLQKADYVFLPVYFEEKPEAKLNQKYCYYTQFVTSVVTASNNFASRERILSPTLKSTHGDIFKYFGLFKMLKAIGLDISFFKVATAYDKAKKHSQSVLEQWQSLYHKEIKDAEDIHIMLLGRPYTVLSQAMNNKIPDIIEKNGIKTFFMDMIPFKPGEISKAEDLLKAVSWKFASKILYAAEIVARTDNCYPVLITSFKCSPDSFMVEYFKEILNYYKKPYLVLQLDEQDSAVGYETRIEAGIRAFRNHHNKETLKSNEPLLQENEIPGKPFQTRPSLKIPEETIRSLTYDTSKILKALGIDFNRFGKLLQQGNETVPDFTETFISDSSGLKNKTVLLPSWDYYVCPLLEAVLKNSGVDARLVNSTQESIQRSLSTNTGQCLPLNIIVQDAIEYIENNNLDPSETVLWQLKSDISCNINMFPHFAKKMLEDYGNGLEKTSVYLGDIVFYKLSLNTAINAYLAYMFGGYIRKIGCKIRPYEKNAGDTNAVMDKALQTLYDAFRYGKPKYKVLEQIISDFEVVETEITNKPKVVIFGDLYVRDNDLMNQNLIKTIEDNGGEVITTPFSEFIKIIVNTIAARRFKTGHYREYAKIKFLKSLIPLVEEKFNPLFYRILDKQGNLENNNLKSWLDKFGLNLLHSGESLDNILKIHSLIKSYPDISLFIQTNPSYCCPSLVTEAMSSRIEEMTGVPVVSIEYDGTTGSKNEDIIPYLKFRRNE